MTKLAGDPKTVAIADQYTVGEVAILYGVSHRTACNMVDKGVLVGHHIPGGKERRVLHESILAHVWANKPEYDYVLSRIITPEPK